MHQDGVKVARVRDDQRSSSHDVSSYARIAPRPVRGEFVPSCLEIETVGAQINRSFRGPAARATSSHRAGRAKDSAPSKSSSSGGVQMCGEESVRRERVHKYRDERRVRESSFARDRRRFVKINDTPCSPLPKQTLLFRFCARLFNDATATAELCSKITFQFRTSVQVRLPAKFKHIT